MIETVITVENLSKSYVVGHISVKGRHSYLTLREVVTRGVSNFAGKAADMVRGRQIVHGEEVEEFWALKDVSFDVKQGEIIGIIGRNGAGKSTLLKILSRITEPTRGRVLLRGRVASLLEVGTGFHPELSGRENIYLNGAILGMRRMEISRKFDEIVAFAQIDKFLDTPVKRYSSGMYVRLAFAIAAHMEPEILLVDEVLAVGDAAFQEKCIGKMNSVAKSEGRTVLFVSHNMSIIQHLCSRALLMSAGRVAADGLPSQSIGDYLSGAKGGHRIELTDWADRISTGEARITRIEIGNGVGDQSTAIGSDLRIKIHARFHEAIIDPNFAVIIHDATGVPLLDVCSIHDGLRLGKVFGDLVVEVRIPEIGLYPGRYLLSPLIMDSACRAEIDFPRLCCTLDVHPAAGPHGDLKLDNKWGKYFVHSHWKSEIAPAQPSSLEVLGCKSDQAPLRSGL